MRRFFVFFIYYICLFALPAAAQQPQYAITESQLRELEILYSTSQSSSQIALQHLKKLQMEAKTLQIKAVSLQTESEKLQNLLKKEREMTAGLNQSVSQLETEIQKQTQLTAKLKEENNALQIGIEKEKRKKTALIGVLSAVLLAVAGYIVLKIRKLIPF